MRSKKYRSNLAKGILIAAAHLMAVVVTCVTVWMFAYPTLGMEAFRAKPAKEYQDSAGFEELMSSYSYHAVESIRVQQLFEKEGNVDLEQLVDIEAYDANGGLPQSESDYQKMVEEGSISGEFQYRLGDLLDWYEKLYNGEYEYADTDHEEQIVVCRKTDNSYYYYKMPEFYDLVAQGDLVFSFVDSEDTGATKEQVLAELGEGYDVSGSVRGIFDSEGRLAYVDCWLYNGEQMSEEYAPTGVDSLLQLVNENKEWNGRLEEAYSMLHSAIYSLGHDFEVYQDGMNGMEEGNTNYAYIYVDLKNHVIYTNRAEYKNYADLEKSLESLKALGKYVIMKPQLEEFEKNIDVEAARWLSEMRASVLDEEEFIFAAAVDTTYPIEDQFYTENQLFERYGSGGKELLMLAIAAILIFLACMVYLVIVAGRREEDEEVHLNWFDRWYTEIAAACVVIVWILVILVGGTVFFDGLGPMDVTIYNENGILVGDANYVTNSVPYLIGFAVLAVITCALFLTGLLSLARRIKAKTLWKNSLLCKIFRFVKLAFHNLNSIWKSIVIFIGFVILQFIVLMSSGGFYSAFPVLLVFAVNIGMFIWLVYRAIGREKLREGIHKISDGEVDYKIPLDKLRGEQREMAEEINRIGAGLDAAVEKSMKSERLKTDLITNVSHDIKTPLTSIINYVELLKQENFEDPKIQHYIEVLEQKAQRLKNLTEDVVEASKVSSGNITLEYMNLNLVEMIQQTSGEFEEKFRRRGLKEVLTLPEEEAIIRADGRRTWRILENIYNNAAKYAMEGTRVYGDLVVEEQRVVFSLKNISEQPLNISAEELTERFIRGDVSRSTEGSGLGLSIAKSLAQMQGGTFELYLDGDLFKVTIAFPRVR